MDTGQCPWVGVLPASEQSGFQGLQLSGTTGSRTTHLAWGANLPWDTGKARGAKGAWQTSVPLLALGTAAALPRERCHPQDLGPRSVPDGGMSPAAPITHSSLGSTHLSPR